MKINVTILCLLIGFCTSTQAGVEHLLPKPHQLTTNTAGDFNLKQNIRLVLPVIGTNDPAINTELTNLITTNGGSVAVNGSVTMEVQLVATVPGAEFQQEAYSIDVTPSKITILATTLKGAYWATQTLWQLADNTGGTATACSITDWPAFSIRGYMLDIGRSYMNFEEVKNEIANLSRYKVNVFHWHLTENQGWRLESKLFPQLNASSSYTRHSGKYYTMAQARELVQWCSKHGVQLIPEIDMPGHSDAFTRAFGYNMQTEQGLATMKSLVTEIIDSCFSTLPILHIGTDEVTMTMANFIPEMVTLIRAKGLKIGTWRRGYNGYNTSDLGLCQLWASSGTVLSGVPNVDSRYHYINHFDDYADVVGIYNSSILEVAKGTAERVGFIMAVWNDRLTRTDRDIVIQNNVYASMLATTERAWLGGGTYITTKGVMLDAQNTEAFRNFADWERRFLFHKTHHLMNEPIAYVKQTNIQWRITDAYPNAGNLSASFPPESTQTPTLIKDTCTLNGVKYSSRKVTGAGIYLRHVWGTLIPAFYANPVANSTAYAFTWVYSPTAQTVGAKIEFQNYGRGEADVPARQGTWDYKGSRIWINDQEVLPPTWESQHTSLNKEIALTNENASARAPIQVNLVQGWNKIFMKLPVGAFSISQVRLVKWMFSCALVTSDGRDAVEGLIYSPEKNLNPSADVLINAIDDAALYRNATQVGTQPGEYPATAVAVLDAALTAANKVKTEGTTEAAFSQAVTELGNALVIFKNSINMPVASTAETTVWYSLYTPYRDNRYLTYKGDNVDLTGDAYVASANNQQWKMVKLSDGTHAIVSKTALSSVSPSSVNNTALKVQAGIPTSGGWNFTPTNTNKTFVITAGSVQFNQTNSGLGYKVYNWGSGSNLTDTGCRYLITEVNRTTEINSKKISGIHIWVEDGRICVSGSTLRPEVFSIDGRKLDTSKQIQNKMVLVKVGTVVQKLILE